MLRRMTFEDFLGWAYYEEVEPFGELREDYRSASVCAAIYNTTLLRAGSRRKRFTPKDFLLEFKPASEREKEEAATTNKPQPLAVAQWKHMKWIAKQHVAIDKAQRTKRQKARVEAHEHRERRNARRKDRV